jgi:hypothetical protein
MADFFNEIGHLILLHKLHQKLFCNFIQFIDMLRFLEH